METVKWKGASGNLYPYEVHKFGASFNAVAANYCVAKLVGNTYHAIYFGQTNNLQDRFSNHEKDPCFRRNGATHTHVHRNSNETTRRSEEVDLIKLHDPVCNK